MIRYQLFHHGIDFHIRAGEHFCLFCLEQHVLDVFHLGRRTAQTEIRGITLHVVHAPLRQLQIGTFVHQREIILVGILSLLSAFRVFVFHHETGISRATLGCRTVHRYHAGKRASYHLDTSFQATFNREHIPVTFLYFLRLSYLRQSQFLGHLRTYLRGVTVNRLTTTNNHVIFQVT